jgi:hypothetical protein
MMVATCVPHGVVGAQHPVEDLQVQEEQVNPTIKATVRAGIYLGWGWVVSVGGDGGPAQEHSQRMPYSMWANNGRQSGLDVGPNQQLAAVVRLIMIKKCNT